MVWKNVKKYTDKEADYISKRTVKKENKPMFCNAHTRKAKELNIQSDCKRTTEKPLTKEQSKIYNQMLEKERSKNNPKSHK